jgi:[ribosomal protein S5]-alanine N-acetyltransferase
MLDPYAFRRLGRQVDIQRTELRTERLLLRPWRFSDLDDAFANASDPEWARYLWRVPQPYTRRDAEEFIAGAVAGGWNGQALFAIELEGHAVGGVRLGIVDPAGMTASIGYNVARPHWGRGIATEAVSAVLRYGFETLKLHRIFATADERNLASIRVMQKLGMKHEATLRRHRYYRGEHADEVHYGILAQEYGRAL